MCLIERKTGVLLTICSTIHGTCDVFQFSDIVKTDLNAFQILDLDNVCVNVLLGV